jgi:hypothetical protein
MLTGGVAQGRRELVLRAANTLAATIDLEHAGSAGAIERATTDAASFNAVSGPGIALAVSGRYGSLRREGALLCAAVGVPRFDSRAGVQRCQTRRRRCRMDRSLARAWT